MEIWGVLSPVSSQQLYLSFASSAADTKQVLEHLLVLITAWTRTNKRKLNQNKTGTLLLEESLYQLEGNLMVLHFPPKDKVHSLGVHLDPSLSLKAQISDMANSAFY